MRSNNGLLLVSENITMKRNKKDLVRERRPTKLTLGRFPKSHCCSGSDFTIFLNNTYCITLLSVCLSVFQNVNNFF